MSQINMKSINLKVVKSHKFKAAAKIKAQKLLKIVKKEALKEFDKHPVTQELRAGPDASNTSGTLAGYGNLSTFMGFGRSDTPVERAREVFASSIQLQKIGKNTYKITMPSGENFSSERMPWESGRSWLEAIEQGISNFSFYMYKKFGEGRSGKAFQSRHPVRSSSYMPTKYLSKMIGNTLKKIKNLKIK